MSEWGLKVQPEFWYLLILLCLVLCGGAWRFLRPNRSNFLMFAGWSGIIAVLMVVYVLRDELQDIPRRIAAELGMESGAQDGDWRLYPLNGNGHAVIEVLIADTVIPMLLDTGASAVMLGRADAVRLGIQPQASDYRHLVQTASGVEYMARVRLPRIQIGTIQLQNIAALVSPKEGISLLGMTALSRLDVRLRGDYVALKPKGIGLE